MRGNGDLRLNLLSKVEAERRLMMLTRTECRLVGLLVSLSAVLLAEKTSLAEVVTLKGGGVVRGQIVAAPAAANIAVRTQTGGLIVFEQDALKQFDRVPHPAKKSPARKSASPSGGLAKSRLPTKEKAWIPKVRSLVACLFSDDPDRSRRARADLLRIADPDAIGALNQCLGDAPSEPARRLHVAILRGIPGLQPTGFLVVQSLYDPSPGVRADARQAIGPQRADAARPLYIECLRSGTPALLSLAALGLGEIGDPHRQSVPFLIEALVDHGTQDVLDPPRPLLSSDCLDEMIEASKSKVICIPRAEGRAEVLDALIKITDQPYPKYGYNVALWRRWWTFESKNADLETAPHKDTIGPRRSTPN